MRSLALAVNLAVKSSRRIVKKCSLTYAGGSTWGGAAAPEAPPEARTGGAAGGGVAQNRARGARRRPKCEFTKCARARVFFRALATTRRAPARARRWSLT